MLNSLPGKPGTSKRMTTSSASTSGLPPNPYSSQELDSSSSSKVATSSLSRHQISYYASKKQPTFQQPSQIASFSYDGQRNLIHDDSSLQEYHHPFGLENQNHVDLNRGIEDWVVRDESVVSQLVD